MGVFVFVWCGYLLSTWISLNVVYTKLNGLDYNAFPRLGIEDDSSLYKLTIISIQKNTMTVHAVPFLYFHFVKQYTDKFFMFF